MAANKALLVSANWMRLHINQEIRMNDIISIISDYFGAWWLADFTFNIQGSLFEKFKGCKVGEEMKGDVITAKDESKWQMIIFPNGEDEDYEGNCEIYLTVIELGGNKEFLAVNYCFEIDEIEWKYEGGYVFEDGSRDRVDGSVFKLKDIEHLNRINIKCSIKPFIKQQNNGSIRRWTLNKYELKTLKTAEEEWKSPLFYFNCIYYNVLVWQTGIYIYYHENGNETEEIILCYSFKIEGTNYFVENKNGKSVNKGDVLDCGEICSFIDLQEMNGLTFICDVYSRKEE
eukprot:423282_1